MKIKYIAFLAVLLLFSCEEDKPGRSIDRPSLQKSGPSFRVRLLNAQGIGQSDSLHFQVKPDSPEDEITRLEISNSYDRKPMFTTKSTEFKIPPSIVGGGVRKLRFKAYFSEGSSTTRYKEVRILAENAPERWKFEVVKKYPHDVSAYTQGFLIYDGFLYEGTGNYGESRLRKIDLTSGNLLQEKSMDKDIFGEGITIFNDKIYQVTYKSGTGFVYDLETFNEVDRFMYSTETGEGWGLTHNDTSLIMSDGSSYLYFLDPVSLEEEKRLLVFDQEGNLDKLNELEYRDGKIYANIYTQPFIVAIDASSGSVTDIYSAMGIVDRSEANTDMDVLNGIAINPASGNLLVTGKYWSKIYEVRPVADKKS